MLQTLRSFRRRLVSVAAYLLPALLLLPSTALSQTSSGCDLLSQFAVPRTSPFVSPKRQYAKVHISPGGPNVLRNLIDHPTYVDQYTNQFSIRTTDGLPDWYVDLNSCMTHAFRSSSPGFKIGNCGFSGLDGKEFWINNAGSAGEDEVWVEKGGTFALYFSNSATAPAFCNAATSISATTTTSVAVTNTQSSTGCDLLSRFAVPHPKPYVAAKRLFASAHVSPGGPKVLNNFKNHVTNVGASLYEFSIRTTDGKPNYYVDLMRCMTHNFQASSPSFKLGTCGLLGLDGKDFYINHAGDSSSDEVWVEKGGSFAIYFSNSATAPDFCSVSTVGGATTTTSAPLVIKATTTTQAATNNIAGTAPIGERTPTVAPTFAPTEEPFVYIPDPRWDGHTCKAAKSCKSDADCFDVAGRIGANPDCGNVFCNRNSCRFVAWNTTCPEYTNCANVHSLCYNGPKYREYLGSCSGYANQECRYAWCPGDVKAGETNQPTSAPTKEPVGPAAKAVRITEASPGSTLGVGGNKVFKAEADFSAAGGTTVTKDVTHEIIWTSSKQNIADFDSVPGLLHAKSSGAVQISATLAGGGSAALSVTILSSSSKCEVFEVSMRALLVRQSARLEEIRGAESALPAIRWALGYVGVPYDEVNMDQLWDGTVRFNDTMCRGNYQAVIVSDGVIKWEGNGLVDKNRMDLEVYARVFSVRTVNWFTWPSDFFGWDGTTSYGSGNDFIATFTPAGEGVFNYVRKGFVLPIQYVWVQASKPLTGSTPLLVDKDGNSLASIYTSNGREMLTMTFGCNEYSRHTVILSYGVINWVTKGRFIGFRRVYLRADMDDFLIDDDIFTPQTPCGTKTDKTGVKWRMNATDLQGVLDWQRGLAKNPITKEVVLDMVYNGIGSNGRRFAKDTLTPLVKLTEHEFRWVSHGWNHLNEDNTTYKIAYEEVYHNQIIARPTELKFTKYTPDTMVTGQVSGLKNPNFLTAARDLGIRYLVSDTSRSGENPGNNLGLYNWFVPEIFMIPRRPNNLFYNVALREDWVHEYNCIFRNFWGRDLTVAEIINLEADQLVGYMLRGEKYPWMFHQANMRIYYTDSTGTKKFLLEELFDATFAKFSDVYTIPITSPAMDVLGRDIISHMEIGTKKVRAILAPGIGMVAQADADTATPFTGFIGNTNLVYGGQNQAYVNLKAGKRKFAPFSS